MEQLITNTASNAVIAKELSWYVCLRFVISHLNIMQYSFSRLSFIHQLQCHYAPIQYLLNIHFYKCSSSIEIIKIILMMSLISNSARLNVSWQMSNYSSMDGILYCKPHFEQLFKESGNFSKNFQTSKLFRTSSTFSAIVIFVMLHAISCVC